MTGGTTSTKLQTELLAIIGRIPRGRVATHRLIAADLKVTIPQVVHMLAALDDGERRQLPWHRVVAEGGAIGRHKWRDAQIAALRAEGVPVSPAGIVDELASRRLTSLEAPASPIEPSIPEVPRGRSRGMKDRP